MHIASRTPEGFPSNCPTCGKPVCVDPSLATGDVPCPNCGALLWLPPPPTASDDAINRLAQLGAFVDIDESGEVLSVQFIGMAYNDAVIGLLAQLGDVPRIDIRHTAITPDGARLLRRKLRNVEIVYEVESPEP